MSVDALLVNVVLDMSGSMGSVWEQTIDVFNEYINGLKVEGEPAGVSLIMFDTEYLPQYFNRPLAHVPALTKQAYVPRGATALLDAMGRCIAETAALEHRPDRVMVVTITDGWENASQEYSRDALVKLVQAKQAEGWEFLYLSASLTAFADARQVGIADGRTLTFCRDAAGMRYVRRAMDRATRSYTHTGSADMRDLGHTSDVSDVDEEEDS